jgi:hypothetical protein
VSYLFCCDNNKIDLFIVYLFLNLFQFYFYFNVCYDSYPVHCAVLGGNLSLLKWLIDENCCPLRSIRVGRGGSKATNDIYTPILTSFKRSLLHIALSKNCIDILRYLVVEKNMPLRAEMRDIPIETLVENLDTVLRILPKESVGHQTDDGMQEISQGSTSVEISTSSASAANVEPEDSSGVNRVEDVSLTQR